MLTRLSRFALPFLLVISLAFPVFAQDSVTLVPYTDPAFNVEGLIPEGWQKLAPGLYGRQSSANDVVMIAQQVVPGMTATGLLTALLPQLGQTELPESIGQTVTDNFTWDDYSLDVALPNGSTLTVRLSVSEKDGSAYVILLQSGSEEADALAESVYVPARAALNPFTPEAVEVPYIVEEVTFDNGDITLSGTLTLPETAGAHPAVVLMTGSGPQTRDEEIIPGFPIFGLIADHLTRNGIAVLRYDDRGVGQSGGEYDQTTVYDFASDGKAAVAYLAAREDINADEIGLLGHSEGGIYSAILGADPDSGVAFIISMAGTAVRGIDLLKVQNELLLGASGASQDVIDAQLSYLDAVFPLFVARDWDAVSALTYEKTLAQVELLSEEERASIGDVEAYAQMTTDNFMAGYAMEWFPTMLEYDPGVDWAKTTVPVLAIFGGLDLQVDAEQNAVPLAEALEAAGNTDFEIVTLPTANHLFQDAVTGNVDEYVALASEFTAEFLPTISDWLLARVTVVE